MTKKYEDMTEEELLKLAETTLPQTEEFNPQEKHLSKDEYYVLKFINDFGIQEGSVEIEPYIIFHMFKDWSDVLMTRNKFFRIFKPIFRHKFIKKSYANYYLLDPTPFDMSDKYKFTARRAMENEEEKNSK